jgi:hypothetical protein
MRIKAPIFVWEALHLAYTRMITNHPRAFLMLEKIQDIVGKFVFVL